jgi:hypothetical protein
MMRRVVLEYNGISDEEFELRRKEARHIWAFGEPLLWLDRRVVKPTVSRSKIRKARKVWRLPSPLPASFEGEGATSPCYLLKGEGARKEGER